MKAAAIDRFGPPSALTVHEIPTPRPAPHEVLIAIDTAGVGSWDASIRDGSWRRPGRPRFPLVPGVDGTGIVVAKGGRVRRLRLGDRVYAYEFGNRQGGFYAEFAAAHAQHVDRVPKTLDVRDAGAVAATGLTALQGIDALGLRPGHTVLIFGASGSVASPREFGKLSRRLASGRIQVPIAASYPLGKAAGASAIGARTRAGTDGTAGTSPFSRGPFVTRRRDEWSGIAHARRTHRAIRRTTLSRNLRLF